MCCVAALCNAPVAPPLAYYDPGAVQYESGDMIVYGCQPGSVDISGGNTTHVCTQGNWTGETLPQCSKFLISR